MGGYVPDWRVHAVNLLNVESGDQNAARNRPWYDHKWEDRVIMKQQTTATTGPVPAPPARLLVPGAIDTETLELLEMWARENATDDPERLKAAQSELDEFKGALNENRAACGERILYP